MTMAHLSPILVATSVNEWFLIHSLTLVATRSELEQALVAFGVASGG